MKPPSKDSRLKRWRSGISIGYFPPADHECNLVDCGLL
jgi:hypothetical protein